MRLSPAGAHSGNNELYYKHQHKQLAEQGSAGLASTPEDGSEPVFTLHCLSICFMPVHCPNAG
jgi:hypothetical protein